MSYSGHGSVAGEWPQVRTDLFRVRHVTCYNYARPVSFGQHRAMVRPHETPDLKLLNMTVQSRPASGIRWIHDVFSNAVTLFDFSERADRLEVEASFDIVRTSFEDAEFPVEDHARSYPFSYAPEDRFDLGPLCAPGDDDPDGALTAFAQRFVAESGGDTWALLTAMTAAIQAELTYKRREEPGVQPPAQTLALASGSCRDFAELMCQAVRRLGFAARFVTGYLYDPALDSAGFSAEGGASGTVTGAGSTHAWVQVFLPGAGWIEFDPTNGDVASGKLIRTGVGRTPQQVAPLSGSYIGSPDDALGLEVSVDISMIAPPIQG
jgi:transglutaminase-like putative cysteine protease